MAIRNLFKAVLAVSIVVMLCVPGVTAATPQARAACALVETFETWDMINKTFLNWVNKSQDDSANNNGWFQVNNSPWNLADITPNLTQFAYTDSTSIDSTGTINDWIISPIITFHNNDTIQFITRTDVLNPGVSYTAYPDRLQVLLSTSGNSTDTGVGSLVTTVGVFTKLLLDINSMYGNAGYPISIGEYPLDWTLYQVQLNGLPPAGASGRMAFRYFVENGGPSGVNSYSIGVDDVSVCPNTTYNTHLPLVIR